MPRQSSNESSEVKSPRKYGLIILQTLKWIFITAIICSFLVGGVVVGYTASLVNNDPVRSREEIARKIDDNAITGFVYFNDNIVVGQLRTDEDRQLIEYKDIPKHVEDAFIAVEDTDFHTHHGVNVKGFMRAVKEKLLNEEVQTGGSTITQQLARRVFLNLDRTTSRKVKEIFLSMRLERYLTKEEIFTAYVNKIPFGNGSSGYNLYGIKAAAKGIFDINDLSKLNIAQSAYLAGLPQLPSEYSAFDGKGKFDPVSFEKAMKRQKLVLERMKTENKITEQQYQEALQFDLKGSLAKYKQKAYATYPYLMLEAERKAAEILVRLNNPKLKEKDLSLPENADLLKDAHEQLLHGGYKIYTTIDKTIYDSMQSIARDKKYFTPDSPRKGVEQVGAIMLDNKSGAILGMIEGRSFYIEQMNHATQMRRQPGSTMKPIAAYIPALEKGIIQPGAPIDDVPLILSDGQKGSHIPENWDGKYHGLITARKALNQSFNIPAIKLFLDPQIGIQTGWDYAKKMGITSLTESDNNARTGVIGGLQYGVSVEEMTNAYTTIANKGVFNDAYMIRKIEDADGKPVYEHEAHPVTVFSEETAYLMTDMMRTVITSGTAKDVLNRFKHYRKIPVVGKTGSTQNDHDAWFMGYSPDISVGVWAGYDQPSTLTRGQGTLRAMRIWSAIMNATVQKKPQLFKTDKFVRPANIVEMTVSDVSGKLPSDLTRETRHVVTDLFNKKFIPTEVDDVLVKMKLIPFNGINYIPHATTPADMLMDKIVIKRKESIKTTLDQISKLLKTLRNPPKRRNGSVKSIKDFYPADLQFTAPSQSDPRVDDGKTPNAPGGVTIKRNGSWNEISFQPSANADVIGYRIYRSVNQGPFLRMDGKVLFTGQQSVFKDANAGQIVYGYYITAVDVAGKESAPSGIVFSDGSSFDPGILSSGTDNPDGEITNVPSPPSNVSVTAGEGDVGVHVTWSSNDSSESIVLYQIYYSNKPDGKYKNIGSSNTNQFVYINLPANGWYRVTAVNRAGESAPSSPVHYK